MSFPARPAQTRIKHEILRGYIGAWMGIICNGIGRRRTLWRQPEFIYLDGFAGPGIYDGEAHDPSAGDIFGSPIIGMLALETGADYARNRWRALDPKIGGVLIEHDEKYYSELITVLDRAGIQTPVVKASSAAPVATGQIRAVCGDYRAEFDELLRSVPEHAFLFAFIDPWAQAARMECVAPLLDRPHTDAIIFFPSWAVHVRGGSILKPEGLRTPNDAGNITRNDQLFGTEAWRAIATDRQSSAEDKVRRYVGLYRRHLEQSPRPFLIKQISLRFSGAPSEDSGYHLFLITDNADGALKMNEVLREAEARKHWELWQDMEARVRQREDTAGLLTLELDLEDQAPAKEVRAPDDQEVDTLVYEAVPVGGTITWAGLKKELADSILTESEIKRSLTRLHRKECVDRGKSSDLRSDAVIHWLM